MRVVLTSITFDPAGVIALNVAPTQTFGEQRRRMNRISTLDGGAVFNDFGYTDADRSMVLRWVPKSAAQEAAVARLVQLYAQITVATPRGLFLAALEVFTPGASESTLSLLVASKLA